MTAQSALQYKCFRITQEGERIIITSGYDEDYECQLFVLKCHNGQVKFAPELVAEEMATQQSIRLWEAVLTPLYRLADDGYETVVLSVLRGEITLNGDMRACTTMEDCIALLKCVAMRKQKIWGIGKLRRQYLNRILEKWQEVYDTAPTPTADSASPQ